MQIWLLMHIAILADIHANLTALEAVLHDVSARGPFDFVVSSGDQVVGGPRPLQTWQALEAAHVYCLLGNTERDIGCGQFPPSPIGGQYRRQIIEVFNWTLDVLPGEVRSGIARLHRRLDLCVDGGPLLVISHANGVDLDSFIWADDDPTELAPLMGSPTPSLLVVGHIHSPLDLQVGSTRVMRAGSVALKYEPSEYNVAHWAEVTWDADGAVWNAERHRVTWDHGAEIDAAHEAGYPGTGILPGYGRA